MQSGSSVCVWSPSLHFTGLTALEGEQEERMLLWYGPPPCARAGFAPSCHFPHQLPCTLQLLLYSPQPGNKCCPSWDCGRDTPPILYADFHRILFLTSHLFCYPSFVASLSPGPLLGFMRKTGSLRGFTCSQQLAISALLPEMRLSLLSADGHPRAFFVVVDLYLCYSIIVILKGPSEGQEGNSCSLITWGFFGMF